MSAAAPDASSRAERSYGFRDVIILFAKSPVAGEVKTRMCPPFTHEQAADFYAEMLDDALVETARIAQQLQLSAVLSVHPARACRTKPAIDSSIRVFPAPLGPNKTVTSSPASNRTLRSKAAESGAAG